MISLSGDWERKAYRLVSRRNFLVLTYVYLSKGCRHRAQFTSHEQGDEPIEWGSTFVSFTKYYVIHFYFRVRWGSWEVRVKMYHYTLLLRVKHEAFLKNRALYLLVHLPASLSTLLPELSHFCSCPTLCKPLDCSPLGFSVHGYLQARISVWVAMPSSRVIFLTQGSNPCLLCLLCYRWIEPLGKPTLLPSRI